MKIDKKLLERYSSGRCSEEERVAVEKWLETVDSTDEGFKSTRTTEESKENTFRKLVHLVPQLERHKETSVGNTKASLAKKVMRYAAAAIILFTVGIFSYHYSDKVFDTGAEQSIALKTINTKRGEKRTVTLSDGSTIRMNYESEIKAPEKFEGDERVVYLTGQAHFDVARDTERPFIIYTENSKTQVLGTSFHINTKEEGETEIIVTSGKVAFSEKDQEDNVVMLTLNDRAVLSTGKHISTGKVDAERLTSWAENILLLEDKKLSEIIRVIEPWFDINVKVKKSSLLSRSFTYADQDPSLTELMDLLSEVGQFEYSIEGKDLIIY
ncbi:MAG: FecR domain-containing protein [Bacteroidota bacterium]